MKSLIYVSNETQVSALPSGSVIPLGNIVRRYGRNIQLVGTSILLRGEGYYDINANVTFTPTSTTAEVYTVTIYQNGVPLEGAKSSMTAGARVTLPVQGVAKLECCDKTANITFVITATTSTNTVTLNNVSAIVEKS